MIVNALMLIFEVPYATLIILQSLGGFEVLQWDEEARLAFKRLAVILFVNRALVIAIVRMSEPQFLTAIKKRIKRRCKSRATKPESF